MVLLTCANPMLYPTIIQKPIACIGLGLLDKAMEDVFLLIVFDVQPCHYRVKLQSRPLGFPFVNIGKHPGPKVLDLEDIVHVGLSVY